MTPESGPAAKKLQSPELQNPTGWGAEWAAIQAEPLAKATYDLHQSRIAALTALELAGQFEAGNIDYLKFSRLMEQARKAAEAEKLPVSGNAGRKTDARGFVKNFLRKEFPQGPKQEKMTPEESVRQSRIAVVQTTGVILQCLEPDHELKHPFGIVDLLSVAAEALNLVGLQQVPKVAKQGQNLAQELNEYVKSQAKSLGVTLPKLEGRPAFPLNLGKVLPADLLYGILMNQPLVAGLNTNADAKDALFYLTAKVLRAIVIGHTEKGAGPNGQNVEEISHQLGWPWRIRALFPQYPYAASQYWSAGYFPYDKISLPTGRLDVRELSIYNFHVQQHLPAFILAEVAGGKLEQFRELLAGPVESYRDDLARYGLKVPGTALSQGGAELTNKLDQLHDSLVKDEEWLNIEVMLGRIFESELKKRKPGDPNFTPSIWQLSEFRGSPEPYAPWRRFGVKDEAEFDTWREQYGDMAKTYFCFEAARKLLSNMGTVARAEREGRIIEVARGLKMVLKWPDEQLTVAVPGLGAKIEALRTKYWTGGDIPWEELVAAYQSEKPGLEAAMKSLGVDLTPRTAADIRRAGENLTLQEAMDKQTGLRRQRLAELILLGETDTFEYEESIFPLSLARYEMLSYDGELKAMEIPTEIVNIRGRNEMVAQAHEWLKTQPRQAREWLRYLILFRMFQDTLAGRLVWPSVQARIYQKIKEEQMKRWGYKIHKYRWPAVGAMIERLAQVEKMGLTPKDLPTIAAAMSKIGLPAHEVKYGEWWDPYQMKIARKEYLESTDPTDVGQNRAWLQGFAEAIKPVSIKIYQLLKQKYGIALS